MNEKRSILSHIQISGFKSISTQHPLELSLSDLNVIIGANGAGKSNLLSLFKMLNHMMTGHLQGFVGENGFAENILYLGAKRTPVLSAEFQFQNKEFENIYTFSLKRTVQDSLIFSDENFSVNGKNFPLGGGHKESLLGVGQNLGENAIRTILSKCRFYQFHDTSSTANIRGNSRIDNCRNLFSDAGNIAPMLYLFKNKPEYQDFYRRIVQFVSHVFPEFEDFVLEPQALNPAYIKLCWQRKGCNDYVFGPDQLSDGTIRFAALATLFLAPPDRMPNIIAIDEPELGLHPLAIDALAVMMKMASAHAQIITATQSPRLLDNLDSENIIVAETGRTSGASEFRHLDSADLQEWLSEYTLSELWDKNILGGLPR